MRLHNQAVGLFYENYALCTSRQLRPVEFVKENGRWKILEFYSLKLKSVMKQTIKLLHFSARFFVLALLSGCIPYPHTTLRSFEVRGRVFDSRTHAPIQGAKIFLTLQPNTSCTTDSEGRFQLDGTRNFHSGIVPPEGDWPQRKYYGSDVTVSHTNHISRKFYGPNTDIGDILLEPQK